MPVLEEQTDEKRSTVKEFAGSVVLHVLVLGGLFGSAYLFHHDGEKWGDSAEQAGAVQATMVSSIPLPPKVQPKEDSVLASETPSVAPPPPVVKAEPPPRPTDVPVVVKKPDKKTPPPKIADKPTYTPPRVQPQRTDPQRAASGQTGGVRIAMQAIQNRIGTSAINVTDQSFGDRFGYYVRQMNQRISQQWYTQTLDSGAQGRRVYLTFRIDRDGTPNTVKIVQSSGDQTLDSSAVRALERIDSLGPLPEGYNGSYINVQYYFEPSQ